MVVAEGMELRGSKKSPIRDTDRAKSCASIEQDGGLGYEKARDRKSSAVAGLSYRGSLCSLGLTSDQTWRASLPSKCQKEGEPLPGEPGGRQHVGPKPTSHRQRHPLHCSVLQPWLQQLGLLPGSERYHRRRGGSLPVRAGQARLEPAHGSAGRSTAQTKQPGQQEQRQLQRLE